MVPDNTVAFICPTTSEDGPDCEEDMQEVFFITIDPDLLSVLNAGLPCVAPQSFCSVEEDRIGKFIELDIADEISKCFLIEHQILSPGHHAALRIYVAAAAKRAVVVTEDDIMTRKEIQEN